MFAATISYLLSFGKMNYAACAAVGLFAVGEIPGLGEFGVFAQFGSVGFSAWIAKLCFEEMKANRRERMVMMNKLLGDVGKDDKNSDVG